MNFEKISYVIFIFFLVVLLSIAYTPFGGVIIMMELNQCLLRRRGVDWTKRHWALECLDAFIALLFGFAWMEFFRLAVELLYVYWY
ncbi:MAG: hypothetical protein HY602_01115 [Parcubacteria group bacterium]|nr:hypothetical protein [Parcubacteria group bacterium]